MLGETSTPVGGVTTAVCAGCRRPIRDQYVLRVDPGLDWHASCLRCVECRRSLDESCTCFVRDGRAYCKLDYGRSAALLRRRRFINHAFSHIDPNAAGIYTNRKSFIPCQSNAIVDRNCPNWPSSSAPYFGMRGPHVAEVGSGRTRPVRTLPVDDCV